MVDYNIHIGEKKMYLTYMIKTKLSTQSTLKV